MNQTFKDFQYLKTEPISRSHFYPCGIKIKKKKKLETRLQTVN